MIEQSQRLFLFFFIVLSSFRIYSQENIIAEVGDINISAAEFRNRFELIPQVNTGRGDDPEILKEDFLYSLIAEKIWALEAGNRGFDTSEIIQSDYKIIEKMYVRDALYNIEIKNKVRVTDAALKEGLSKISTLLNLKTIHSSEEEKINLYHSLLNQGTSFDSLYLSGEIQIPAIEVKFGEMKKTVEDIIFNLKTGEFTEPVKTQSGWVIFYLDRKDTISFNGPDDIINRTKKIIEERITDSLYHSFVSSILKGNTISANGILFWSAADKITSLLIDKKSKENIPDGESLFLDNNDIKLIMGQLGTDTLSLPFINFDNPLTLKDFFASLKFEGFYSDTVEPDKIAAKLNARVRLLIEQEFLTREGYRRGLQNLPEVKNFLNMWLESYLSKILYRDMADSSFVNDDEAYDYYMKMNERITGTEVNIVEILTDSLEVIEKVLTELKAGRDFRELAAENTKRKWTKINSGEFGFFPVYMYGEIGRKAEQMEVGDIYGPIKVEEGYSIFKLIAKRDEQKDSSGSFTEIKEKLKKELSYKKFMNNIINYTVNLAHKYGVKIHTDAFAKLQVKDWKMFTYKYIGFGGRITAVPLTYPFYEWAEEWKNQKEIP
jgi:peptidyl-prolyl cis-trans isomerase C